MTRYGRILILIKNIQTLYGRKRLLLRVTHFYSTSNWYKNNEIFPALHQVFFSVFCTSILFIFSPTLNFSKEKCILLNVTVLGILIIIIFRIGNFLIKAKEQKAIFM